MYEPSKIMQSFFIAGFQYHDGALALKKLKAGKKLELVAEPDNPHDPDAVAIYRKGVHLGYVPGDSNATIAQLLRFGHANVLECRIMQVDKRPIHGNRCAWEFTSPTIANRKRRNSRVLRVWVGRPVRKSPRGAFAFWGASTMSQWPRKVLTHFCEACG